MGNVAELDTTRLVIAAIIGLALLLVLIIKFKVHAMLSILIGADSVPCSVRYLKHRVEHRL